MRKLLLLLLFVQGYPAGEVKTDTLKFSHKTHINEVGATCLDCHTNATVNTGKGMSNHPKMENCRQCHEEDFTNKNCARCHSEPDKAKPFSFKLYHRSFSHADHLKRGVECLFCHKGVDQVSIATEKNLPSMDVCWSCHDDKKAPRNCHLCHDDPEKIKPASHKSPRFLKKEHGRDARYDRMECEKCHRETLCDACHTGQMSTRIHVPNFTFTHGKAAKKGDTDCSLCHEVDQSCIRCHTKRN